MRCKQKDPQPISSANTYLKQKGPNMKESIYKVYKASENINLLSIEPVSHIKTIETDLLIYHYYNNSDTMFVRTKRPSLRSK